MDEYGLIGKITFTGVSNPKEGEYLGIYDVFIVDANGHNLKQLTFGDEWLCNSSISPDGTKIAFTQRIEGEDDSYGYLTPDEFACYVMNSDGTGRILLMEMRLGYGSALCFSPDSKQILFSHDGIYVIDIDGNNLKQLTTEGGFSSASFASDGLSIIYTYVREKKESQTRENRYDSIGIFIMNVDGSDQRLLFPFSLLGENCQNWVVSPDCSKIAYEAYTMAGCTVDKSAIYIADMVFDFNNINPKMSSPTRN